MRACASVPAREHVFMLGGGARVGSEKLLSLNFRLTCPGLHTQVVTQSFMSYKGAVVTCPGLHTQVVTQSSMSYKGAVVNGL